MVHLLALAAVLTSGDVETRQLPAISYDKLPGRVACWDDFGRASWCFIACNQWGFENNLYVHIGPGSCRFACVDAVGDVVSCGHECQKPDACVLAEMDPDLAIYPGADIPDELQPYFSGGPYLDPPLAVSLYGVP